MTRAVTVGELLERIRRLEEQVKRLKSRMIWLESELEVE